MKRICFFLNGQYSTSLFKIKIEHEVFHPYYNLHDQKIDIENYIVDGGLNHFLKNKFPCKHLYWIGDGDSLNKKGHHFLNKKSHSFIQKIQLNPNKDFSDFAALLDIILKSKLNDKLFIEVYGGLGKRRDHEIANIEEMKRFINLLPYGGCAYFHAGVIITTLPIEFLKINFDNFSIFANSGSVIIEGAHYSGNFNLERPSHGLSNKVENNFCKIQPVHNSITFYFEEKIDKKK